MSQEIPLKERLWTLDFIFLTIIQTVDLFTYNMVTPIIAKYTTIQGATLVLAGFIASAFALAAIFARPVSGFLSDRMGRKKLIAVSIVVDCLSLLGYAFTTNFTLLILIRIIHGFFYALFGTSIAAAATSVIPESRRGEGLSWFSMSYVFANALAPALGVFLSGTFGYLAMFIFGACIAAASFFMVLKLKVKDTKGAPAFMKFEGVRDFISPRCLPLAVVICAFAAIWGIIATFVVMVGDERGVAGISLFFTFNAIALFFSRPPAGRLRDRKGLSVVYYPAAVFEAVAIVLIAFSHQLWMFLVSAVCKALGSGTAWPSIQARCAELETKDRSGVAMATFLLGTDIGYTIGPIIGGAASDAYGYTTMFLLCLPILAIGVIVYGVWAHSQGLKGAVYYGNK